MSNSTIKLSGGWMIEEKDVLEIQREILKGASKNNTLLLPSAYKKMFIKIAKQKGFSEDDCLKADKELAFEKFAYKVSVMKDERMKDISVKINDTKENLIVNLDSEASEIEESVKNIKNNVDGDKKELKSRLDAFINKYSHLVNTIHNIRTNIEDIEDSIKHATEMSIQDPITLLGNCKYFEMSFEGELYMLKRYKIPASLMLIRMKNLGQVRDKYGASVELSVIKNLAKIIYENIRSSDMLFRCDNGDFRIFMHNTDEEKAQIFAQKIKYLIGRVVFQKNDDRFRINILHGTNQIRADDTIDSILMRMVLNG